MNNTGSSTLIDPAFALYVLVPVGFVLILFWAFWSDRRTKKQLGVAVHHAMGVGKWDLIQDGIEQAEMPFYSSLPKDSLTFIRQEPCLHGIYKGANAWIFANIVTKSRIQTVIGDSVMTVIELPSEMDVGFRVEKQVRVANRVFSDERFDLLSILTDFAGKKWMLQSTEISDDAVQTAGELFSLVNDSELEFFMIYKKYLVTSGKTCFGKIDYYRKSWAASTILYDGLISVIADVNY